jgi:deoxyguanosine kinase
MKSYNYIVIEGNIGAGKTTLARMFAEKLNGRLILERLGENPFLPKFYDNPQKNSFPLELSFLAERYHQLNEELQNRDLFHPLTIADYYLMKSLIFSRTNLTDDEFRLYRQIFDIISANLIKPDLYVYLHLNLDNLIRNIKNRGRYFEQNIQKDYLVKIQDGYMDFFKQQKALTILMIDANELDFYNNSAHFERIVEIVFQKDYALGINKVIP